MTPHLRSAVVLGAGTMGAQIAAHLANAGIPSLLLDVTAEAAAAGLTRAKAIKPDPFMVPEAAALIRTGSLDDLTPLAESIAKHGRRGRGEWERSSFHVSLEMKGREP